MCLPVMFECQVQCLPRNASQTSRQIYSVTPGKHRGDENESIKWCGGAGVQKQDLQKLNLNKEYLKTNIINKVTLYKQEYMFVNLLEHESNLKL